MAAVLVRKMTSAFIPGFLVGLSLILAIGAQNAFVLRQGLRREHVFAVCAVCAGSDAVLIAAGVAGADMRKSLRATIITRLAFTWLNPHVYLGTLVLLGSISAGYGQARTTFALGYGARLLRPLFAKPKAWRVLDAIIGVTMLALEN